MQCNKNRYLFTPLNEAGKKERKTMKKDKEKNKQLPQTMSYLGKLWAFHTPMYRK